MKLSSLAISIVLINVLSGQPSEAPLRFEVATIKPTHEGGGRGGMVTLPGGELRLGGVTLKMLIAMAYGVRDDQISGGPRWIGSSGFDIVAKPERPEGTKQPAPGTPGWARMERRLQTLLAERFQLKFHKESKEATVYTLVFVKEGPKLHRSENEDVPPSTMRSADRIVGRAGTMQMLANLLSNWLGRPVEDQTGLTGKYDYTLEYAPDSGFAGKLGASGAPPADSAGPSVFTALQEQLGLKLQTVRGSIESIIIDRAEKPSDN